MPASIQVGDEAPNFDLSSTEDVLLMLRDEVYRTAVVLYFFADPGDERARRDLVALDGHRVRFAELRAKVLAVSPAKLPALKELQRELHLLFPLLSDDRDFAAAYGVRPASPAQEEGEVEAPAPALFVVSRQQRVLWRANPVASMEGALPEVVRVLAGAPAPSANYPRAVVHRLVDWWVNRGGRLHPQRPRRAS